MPFLQTLLTSPDEIVKEKVLSVQEYSLLAAEAVANLFRRPRYLADMLQQMDFVGVGSLPIVVLTGLSIGAVLALQTSTTLQQFGSVSLTGQLVSFSMIKEIGPVLTSLMLAGRAATGMASELGSMKVTEQIDAMRALGTDPVKKLVTPRVISTVVMLFFLTILSDLMGLFGGYLVCRLLLEKKKSQGAGERVDRSLAGGIVGLHHVHVLRRNAGDVDDPPAPRPHHRVGHGLAKV